MLSGSEGRALAAEPDAEGGLYINCSQLSGDGSVCVEFTIEQTDKRDVFCAGEARAGDGELLDDAINSICDFFFFSFPLK